MGGARFLLFVLLFEQFPFESLFSLFGNARNAILVVYLNSVLVLRGKMILVLSNSQSGSGRYTKGQLRRNTSILPRRDSQGRFLVHNTKDCSEPWYHTPSLIAIPTQGCIRRMPHNIPDETRTQTKTCFKSPLPARVPDLSFTIAILPVTISLH